MLRYVKKKAGFTIIELMVTIAIIGVLASIAIPAYISYENKVRFAEVVTAVDAFKSSVGQCVHLSGTLTGCNNASNGIPVAQTSAGCVASVTVVNGVITGTGVLSGTCLTAALTYTLTPTLQANGVLVWVKGGTCIASAWC